MKQETPRFSAEFVSSALGLPLAASDGQKSFQSVTTDSRKAGPGMLFVAIPGEKFDGHDFIPQAIAAGASGIICRKNYSAPQGSSALIFSVEDTLTAYRNIAAAWRRAHLIPTIAVAGSVGKTTTKEILAAILRGKWPMLLKTQGSQNGFVGIPMTLLELNSSHQAAVIEVGIDDIGAMAQHMRLLAPTAGILTAIGPEHLENLKNIPTVAREEALALEAVDELGGLSAINLDDPWIAPLWDRLKKGTRIGFTLSDENTPSQSLIVGKLISDGTVLEVSGGGVSQLCLALPLPGKHNALNLLGAVALALGLGLGPSEIEQGLLTFEGAEGRSRVVELPRGITALCDYYNASPVSMAAGLELLADLSARKGKPKARHACLGDMLELGTDESRFHREVADPVMRHHIENVYLYGSRMPELLAELKARGFSGKARHFASHAEMANALLASIQDGECVLIKGSRSMKMEEVWKSIQARLTGRT